MEQKILPKIAIIGSGLVGTLCACYFGKRGYEVHLYEYRGDIRVNNLSKGRSINLALSTRGCEALKGVNLDEKILENGIPMYGRMLHSVDGSKRQIPYDPVFNRCIYSIGRKELNGILLNDAEKLPNVHLYFEHKLINLDFANGKMTFKKSDDNLVYAEADLIVGADGAFSVVRNHIIKQEMVNYSQTYINHGYMELCIPPENNHLMARNHLHIWPRGGFMMIALPNQDGSWTVTLFMPFQKFSKLNSKETILSFFQQNFPDSIKIIGEEFLVSTVLKSKPSSLISIKCSQYHVGSRAVIIGDAAHAMVPFYGQGMNAGFEDVRLLDDLLHNHNYSIAQALHLYSSKRNPNAEAICDLAMYNYLEMSDLVNRSSFLIRKNLDNLLYRIAPNFWIPLYQSVTFSNLDYKMCMKNKKWQDAVLHTTSVCLIFFCICIFLIIFIKWIYFKIDIQEFVTSKQEF